MQYASIYPQNFGLCGWRVALSSYITIYSASLKMFGFDPLLSPSGICLRERLPQILDPCAVWWTVFLENAGANCRAGTDGAAAGSLGSQDSFDTSWFSWCGASPRVRAVVCGGGSVRLKAFQIGRVICLGGDPRTVVGAGEAL